MGKVEISYFFWTDCRYLNFVFAEIFIEYISMFHVTFSYSFILIGCWGHIKGKISKNI